MPITAPDVMGKKNPELIFSLCVGARTTFLDMDERGWAAKMAWKAVVDLGSGPIKTLALGVSD
jgi:hypothetical protein